jgi:hypothetical protein
MFKIHSLFPLFRFLMSFLALGFAAGDGGFLSSFGDAGGAPPIDLGADEGEADTGGEPVVETTAGEGEPKEGEEPAGDKKTAPGGEPAPDLAKPLSKDAKKFMGELKQTNPAAWKELNNRIWSLNGLDKKIGEHFEGGLDEAIALKGNLDTFLKEADADDLGQIKDELSGFRTIDKQIMDGNPAFVNSLPPEMQDGLYRMMPTFVQDWRARDNDGFERYFGGLVVNTVRDTGFQKNLEMAQWQLKAIESRLQKEGLDPAEFGIVDLKELFAGNLKWINDLDTKAKTPPEKKAAPVEDQVTVREKNVKAEELKLSRTRIVSKFRDTFNGKMLSELKKVSAGTDGKIPANVNKGEVLLRAMSNLAGVLGSQVERRVDQYLASKDEQGAFAYLQQQTTDKRLNEAVTKAYRYLYGSGGAHKPKPAPGDKGDKGAGAEGGGQPAAGFISINYDPKASSIDVGATTKLAQSMRLSYRQLVSQNKCVLRNGKRVTWPRDAQAEE